MAKNKITKRAERIGFTIMIAFAVIAFWRGLWGLIDLYILPNNPPLRYWTSMIIGAVILIVTDYITREF